MWEFVIGFAFGMYFWRCWTHPRTKKVKPGLNADILLPHTDELVLHYNMLSSCSQKVRACLGEAGLKHRMVHHSLPSSGGWETKSVDYLSNINPAGTVPVLLHNGHPVYESHEQIQYIERVLMGGDSKLTPKDPASRALVDKWIELGSMVQSEVFDSADPWDGMSKRLGNLLGPMTMPLFCANVVFNFSALNLLESLSMLPLVSNRIFIMLHFMFKIFGVESLRKLKKLHGIVSCVRRGLNYHFATLTRDLEESGGPYLCGEEYTLADISLVPVFERMGYAGWWTDSLIAQFPLVHTYWVAIQQREGYKSSRPDAEMHNKMMKIGEVINKWKHEQTWFNDLYEC